MCLERCSLWRSTAKAILSWMLPLDSWIRPSRTFLFYFYFNFVNFCQATDTHIFDPGRRSSQLCALSCGTSGGCLYLWQKLEPTTVKPLQQWNWLAYGVLYIIFYLPLTPLLIENEFYLVWHQRAVLLHSFNEILQWDPAGVIAEQCFFTTYKIQKKKFHTDCFTVFCSRPRHAGAHTSV